MCAVRCVCTYHIAAAHDREPVGSIGPPGGGEGGEREDSRQARYI